MTVVAVASSSQLAADAGAAVAAAGGNAIDAAIAASLTSMTTEPGVCSLGASGYITIWPRSGSPVTIDGYADMPGLGVEGPADPDAAWPIRLSYGGGMTTIVGYGSVAVPGGVAALELAEAVVVLSQPLGVLTLAALSFVFATLLVVAHRVRRSR